MAAVRGLEALAEKGDTTAQFKIGLMHVKGEGIPKDAAKALMWFRKAGKSKPGK